MNSLKKRLAVAIAIILVFSVSLLSWAESKNVEKTRSVILFIGDGMGINQLKAAEIYSKLVLNKDLAINSIGTSGLTTTHAANSPVTDSAAAATALYSGYKTNTGKLNILPDGRKASTVGDAAKKAGMSVGVVSTTRLTDATPAAMYSKSPRRDCEAYIAQQLPDFAPDVALGGGLAHFVPSDQKGSKRKDEKDIVQAMKSAGYDFVEKRSQLIDVNPGKVDKLFGLFSNGNMTYAIDRQNNRIFSEQPSLAEMTRVALSIVGKNPKGFFIMIEGGRIDHASHTHDIRTMIGEVLDFDEAVEVGLKYQETHPDVLVIVTADHETGGLTAAEGPQFGISPLGLAEIKRSLHSIADKIKREPSNRDSILKTAGLKLTPEEIELLEKEMINKDEANPSASKGESKEGKYMSSDYMKALSILTSRRAKVQWTTFGHTGNPVATRAVGPGQEQFSGNYDNTDIPQKISKLLNLKLSEPLAAEDVSSSGGKPGSATSCP